MRYENQCVTMPDEVFLNWVADRLVQVLHDATNNTDYIERLRKIAKEIKRVKEN